MSKTSNIDSALDTLMDSIQSDVPRLDIRKFLSTYLPALASTEYDVGMRGWLAIAGNYFNPVDIVNPDGSIAFRVPPMMVSPPTRMPNSSRGSISTVVNEVENRSKIMPAKGEAFFRALVPKMVGKCNISKDHLQQWNQILADNGYKPLSSKAIVDQSTDKTESDSLGFIHGEYDDI